MTTENSRADALANEKAEVPYVERFAESCMEGGGVYPSDEGDFVRYSDFVALARAASPASQPAAAPIEAISKLLGEAMDRAAANGADSRSMPDEYVAIAHFTCYPEEYGYAKPAPSPADERAAWDNARDSLAVAPMPPNAQLRRVMDLLDAHLGDSDPTLEGMTQEEIEEEFPVVAAMQIIVGLYQYPPAAADTAPSPADERAAWQTGVPPVKEGSYAGFIVACRRKHNGEVYVFEANYANQYAEELRDDDGEEFTAHGWYDVAQDIHGEYSSIFSKTCGEGDEIVGWQPLPKWSDQARAASANETERSK